MPWVFLALAVVASIYNTLDGRFKANLGEDGQGIGWVIIIYFMWKIFTPALLFILAAITWIWRN